MNRPLEMTFEDSIAAITKATESLQEYSAKEGIPVEELKHYEEGFQHGWVAARQYEWDRKQSAT